MLADVADLKKAEMKAMNEADRKESKKHKAEHQALAKKVNINSSTGANRRQNLQDEVAATGQSPMPISLSTLAEAEPEKKVAPSSNNDDLVDDSDYLIAKWLESGE